MNKAYVFFDGTHYAKINPKTLIVRKTEDINKATVWTHRVNMAQWRFSKIQGMEIREVRLKLELV